MTHELETVLRETLAANAQLMDDRELIGPVQARAARRRRRRMAGAGAAVLVALVATGGAQALRHAPAPPPTAPATIPADWRAESTRGVQIRVPAHWTDGDLGCGMDARPTVKKEGGGERLCYTAEPATKEAAVFGSGVNWPTPEASFEDRGDRPKPPATIKVIPRPVRVSGLPAERAEFRLPDGRYAGWVRPAGHLTVTVRTLSAERTRLILDSVELITRDANGCAVDRPRSARPTAPAEVGDWFAPPATSSVLVCSYAEFGGPLLDSRVATDGALVSALNRAHPGHNPNCTTRKVAPLPPELVMHFRDAGGNTMATAYLRLAGCVERGFDNGRSRVEVGPILIGLATRDIFSAVGFHQDLMRRN